MIVCGNCVLADLESTRLGKLVGDEAVTMDIITGEAETPAQCDNCLTQSDDYEELFQDDD